MSKTTEKSQLLSYEQMKQRAEIRWMEDFYQKYGENALKDAIFYGAFESLNFAFVHPTEKFKQMKNFDIFHKAFINAYT